MNAKQMSFKAMIKRIADAAALDLWTASIWAQVSVYALADKKWHASFRPKGVTGRAWAKMTADHIVAQLDALEHGTKEAGV